MNGFLFMDKREALEGLKRGYQRLVFARQQLLEAAWFPRRWPYSPRRAELYVGAQSDIEEARLLIDTARSFLRDDQLSTDDLPSDVDLDRYNRRAVIRSIDFVLETVAESHARHRQDEPAISELEVQSREDVPRGPIAAAKALALWFLRVLRQVP
jgi:hypothetical protein